jgi:RNA polymerase sigma factor (sigma-70 family)
MSPVTPAQESQPSRDDGAGWRLRSARLYEELKNPACSMVRRAFRGAFSEDEVEDIYANAWVGTLRALERRQARLDDDEIRRYVFTAVAHHAGKELRRRKRRPTAPLENAAALADTGGTPEDRATQREHSRVTRDLLSSLPPRRRAVLMLRYGWGLEPAQVCALVKGLSPRAYRKEITRGVDELTEKLRVLERGEWCAEREPVLKAYAAGLADAEQERQARQHLSHCRPCSGFVGKLTGQLHDLGSTLAAPGAADVLDDGRLSIPDRVAELAQRLSEMAEKARDAAVGIAHRGDPSPVADSVGPTALAGGTRGAGAAGAGVVAKLAGLGVAGKATVACLSGGVAVTACVAAGVGPVGLPGEDDPHRGRERAAVAEQRHEPEPARAPDVLPSQVGKEEPAPTPPSDPPPSPSPDPPPDPPPAEDSGNPPPPAPAPAPEPAPPPPPPVQSEFGVAPPPAPPATGSTSASSPSAGGSGGSATRQQFGQP